MAAGSVSRRARRVSTAIDTLSSLHGGGACVRGLLLGSSLVVGFLPNEGTRLSRSLRLCVRGGYNAVGWESISISMNFLLQ